MSLYAASLNSGSNGNCYYIGNREEAVLIDAGISCRETERRMKRLALSIKKVKAIFVTHEHSDHINGVTMLSKKYQLPVYITPLTLSNSSARIKIDLIREFKPNEAITLGSLTITAHTKSHDAVDPHNFIVTDGSVRIGVFTDIGHVCHNVVDQFKQCHAAFLESNYDDKMLDEGGYPFHLRNRIRNGKGHLSNVQAAQLFMDHAPSCMSHLFLSHLSRHNNKPEIAESLFKKIANGTEIIVASRYVETELYTIENTHELVKRSVNKKHLKRFSSQLSLFQQ